MKNSNKCSKLKNTIVCITDAKIDKINVNKEKWLYAPIYVIIGA